MKKMLIIDVAALGWDLVQRHGTTVAGCTMHPVQTVFPAVTCPAQASFRTAQTPSQHGITANGFFSQDLKRAFFWEQSATLVTGRRIWQSFRESGGRVGIFFWQQSLGESVDWLVSPKPIHKHHGGMIQDCYSRPHDLYDRLTTELRRPFSLSHYWGPLASSCSSEWIAAAVAALVQWPDAPELLLTYLPHLDYDLQRYGPYSANATRAFQKTVELLELMCDSARDAGYEILIFGDYAMQPVTAAAIFPNRVLADAGLFRSRTVNHMLYPDYYSSRAFALVDHQVAHAYTVDDAATDAVIACFDPLTNVEVIKPERMQYEQIDHPRGGNLLLLAADGQWFAYPWWYKRREAPDFASHVDIHNKPGYDPCELFFKWLPPGISSNTERIAGTHGRAGNKYPVAWGSTVTGWQTPAKLQELAKSVSAWLTT